MTIRVDILLATHNGAAWLPEFIESLGAQSFAGWRLLARDDDSTDGTRRQLEEWAAVDPRVVVTQDDRGRMGVTRNFARLLNLAQERDADYVFFADQDDTWLHHKIERFLARAAEVEDTRGIRHPLLLHSDLVVVNSDMTVVAPSLHARLGIDAAPQEPMPELLGVNYVTGCAAMMNRALLNLVVPVPHEAVLHDWWSALCAAAFGSIIRLPEATVFYRQHGGNSVGAARGWSWIMSHRRSLRDNARRLAEAWSPRRSQAQALLARMEEHERLTRPKALDAARRFIKALEPDTNRWQRLLSLRQMLPSRMPWSRRAAMLAAAWIFEPDLDSRPARPEATFPCNPLTADSSGVTPPVAAGTEHPSDTLQ